MCLAAGIVLAQLPSMVTAVLGGVVLPPAAAQKLGRLLQSGLMLLTVALSFSRSAALVYNYSAPMSIYLALPPVRLLCHSMNSEIVFTGSELDPRLVIDGQRVSVHNVGVTYFRPFESAGILKRIMCVSWCYVPPGGIHGGRGSLELRVRGQRVVSLPIRLLLALG